MTTEKSESEAIAGKVRELMERHGIAERKQTGELGRILELGFSAAHRKINGESPWTVSQIIQVAAHYNETPGTLLNSIRIGGTPLTPNITQDAILVVSEHEFPCVVQIGKPLSENQPVSFAAFDNGYQWRVVEMREAPAEHELHSVEKIEIYPTQVRKLSIAIVDDDPSVANNIRDYLNDNGFKAVAFYTIQSTTIAMRDNEFDAYVIDWLMGSDPSNTSEGLLKAIRALSKNPNAPVILLTGGISAGIIDETEMAALIRRYNVLCQEKPEKLAIITVELSKMLGLN